MSEHPNQKTSLNRKGQHKDTSFVDDFRRHATALVDELGITPPLTPKQATGAETVDYQAWLEAARVRPTDEVEQETACLSIEQEGKSYVIGTLGNISTIAGRAKAKKTFAVSFAVAAAVASMLILNRIKGTLPKEKQTVLLFDTEQSRQHVLRIVKRICRLSGIEDPPNLIVYSLRSCAPPDRLKLIEFAAYNTPGLGLVVIDGVRDLAIDPVLDSEQASHIMTHLLRWTDQLDIHIMCVLHQNKNDTNLRGHLGTELTNKSETVISVTQHQRDKTISTVAPEYCRDQEFDEFSFSVDEFGLPFLVDQQVDNLDQTANGRRGKFRTSKPTAETMTLESINAVIERAFMREANLPYTQLRTNIMEASQFVGAALTKNETELLISRVTHSSHLIKYRPEKSRWNVYRINPDYLTDYVS